MEENLEIYNTIEETPYLLYESYKSPNLKKSLINYNDDNNEKIKVKAMHCFLLTSNILNNNKEGKNKNITKNENDLLLNQRENRKIMVQIKRILSKNGNHDKKRKIILIKKILLNYKRNIATLYDDKNNTLLHLYVEDNNIEAIKIILYLYSDILHFSEEFYNFLFIKNIDNKTIFDITIQNNYISIMKLLFVQIENEQNNKNKKKYMDYFKDNIFYKCIEYEQCNMILFFYEKLNEFYNYFDFALINNSNYDNQMSPLHIACKKGNKKIINILLDLGCDINSKDIKGYTPLFYAVISKNENLVKTLILRGANKFIKDLNNQTPYDLAV